MKQDCADPIIRCRGLTLGYGDEIVLEDVDLSIPAGVFLPFVGPNGAGKTTLLRAILGLIPPIKGRIQTPFAHAPPGYVSQLKAIDPLYPVSALNIVLMGAYRCMGWHGRGHRSACVKEARRWLAEFGLKDHEHKTFDELSGGMRQKVLVARALATSSDVLIMDEPTTELDYRAQRDLLNILKQAAQRDGRTVLLVHHGLDLVRELSSEVCLVHEGKAVIVPIGKARF